MKSFFNRRFVEKYNEIATQIVLKHGGIINDLYDLLKDKHNMI